MDRSLLYFISEKNFVNKIKLHLDAKSMLQEFDKIMKETTQCQQDFQLDINVQVYVDQKQQSLQLKSMQDNMLSPRSKNDNQNFNNQNEENDNNWMNNNEKQIYKFNDLPGSIQKAIKDQVNETLKLCQSKVIQYCNVQSPDTRICPNCQAVIHHTENCKNLFCWNCKTGFCLICLCTYGNGRWPHGGYAEPCKPAKYQNM